MAITGILRVGLIQFRVLDFEQSLVHYRDRIGLNEVGKIDEDRIMLKGYDEFDHHSVVLRRADRPGLDFIAFKADSREKVQDVLRRTREEFGYTIEELNDQPGYGTIYLVNVSTGHKVGVYSDVALAEKTPMIHNPHIWDEQPRGFGATHFDHALLYGPNAAETVRWFTDVRGLAITEELQNAERTGNICTWLSASTRGHDVAVLEFPEPGKLHHVSFHLQTWDDVGRAADIMARYGITIDAGPMRHGITRGQTIYFFDPSGNRNETFAGGYEFFPDNPRRYWDAERAGEGVFYYNKALNSTFLSVYS